MAAIDTNRTVGVEAAAFAGNDRTGWDADRSAVPAVAATVDLLANHPALLPWLAIFMLPAFNSLRQRQSAARLPFARIGSSETISPRTEER